MSDRIEWEPGKYPNTWCSIGQVKGWTPRWSITISGTHWENDQPIENVKFDVRYFGSTLARRETEKKAKDLAALLDLVFATVYL